VFFWLIACENGRHVSNKVNDYPPTLKKKMFLYDEQRERNREMADSMT